MLVGTPGIPQGRAGSTVSALPPLGRPGTRLTVHLSQWRMSYEGVRKRPRFSHCAYLLPLSPNFRDLSSSDQWSRMSLRGHEETSGPRAPRVSYQEHQASDSM